MCICVSGVCTQKLWSCCVPLVCICEWCVHTEAMVLLCPSPPCPLSQGLAEPGARLAASKLHHPLSPPLQCWGYRLTASFSHGCQDLNSSPHACTESSVPLHRPSPLSMDFPACGRCRSRVEHYYTVMEEFWGPFLTRDLDHDVTGFLHAPPPPSHQTHPESSGPSEPISQTRLGDSEASKVAVRFGGLPCSRCSGHGHVTTHLPQTLHVARLLLPGLLGSCARCSLFLLEAAWVGRGGKQLGEWSGKCSFCRKGLRESACCVSGCAPWTLCASMELASSGPLPADSVSVCE